MMNGEMHIKMLNKKRGSQTKRHRENISNGLKDKKHSNMHKENIGKSVEGKNNGMWQGGISFEPYPPEFNNRLKREIRKRDNYQCQLCGIPENGRAHILHHINYNKKDNRERNFILLCNSCNAKANFERDKWQFCFEILQELNGLVA